jgi:hypothetical protein
MLLESLVDQVPVEDGPGTVGTGFLLQVLRQAGGDGSAAGTGQAGEGHGGFVALAERAARRLQLTMDIRRSLLEANVL